MFTHLLSNETAVYLLIIGLAVVADHTLKNKNDHLMANLLLGFNLMMLTHAAPIEIPLMLLLIITALSLALELSSTQILLTLSSAALIIVSLLQGALGSLMALAHWQAHDLSSLLTLTLFLIPLLRKRT